MDSIFERAALWGIETQYRDGFGRLRTVEPDVLARLLDTIVPKGEFAARMLPRTIVLRAQCDGSSRLAADAAWRYGGKSFR
jgi:hypothetical protein